jgi:hypothetical protein
MVRSIISNRGGVALNGVPFAAGDTVRWVPRKGVVSVAKFRSRPEDRGDSAPRVERSEAHAEHMAAWREDAQPPMPPRRRRDREDWGDDHQD